MSMNLCGELRRDARAVTVCCPGADHAHLPAFFQLREDRDDAVLADGGLHRARLPDLLVVHDVVVRAGALIEDQSDLAHAQHPGQRVCVLTLRAIFS
jgi:hypothetical protein